MTKLNSINPPFPTEGEVNTFGYNILETTDFFIDLLQEIDRATSRIWLQTMAFEYCHFTSSLVRSLIMASQKGVDGRLIRDAYSDYVTDSTFNRLPLPSKTDRSRKKAIMDNTVSLIEDLRGASIITKKTNVPTRIHRYTPLPGVMGRDHKKVAIVDNTAYIGGVNMTSLDARRIDFMLKTNNACIVAALMNLFCETLSDVPQSDRVIPCDGNNLLLVDGGEPMQSIIMKNAYDVIDREQGKIVLVSPYFPSSTLSTKLNKAVKRGVTVEFITSSRESLSGFAPKMSQFVHNLGSKKKLFSTFYANGIIHAKALLAFGNREAIVGSHNFDELFVELGTEEASLQTREPEIFNELVFLINKLKLRQQDISTNVN